MIVNLRNIYYNFFLAMFAVIIFSNLIPSEWVGVTRIFVFPTAIFSFLLFNNLKGLFYIIIFYLFVFLYSLYPLLNNTSDIYSLFRNTKYLMYFVFIFGLINVMQYIPLERFLYNMSQIFILKLIIVAVISFNMNFNEARFANYILNIIDLNVHRLFGKWRVFDIYLILFPLVLIYIKNKKKYLKIVVHLLLLFNILSAMTFGILFSYITILFFSYKLVRTGFVVIISILFLLCYNQLFSFYNIILVEKSVSISVKWNQMLFLWNNLSFFGNGLGTPINIQGRLDYMLENVLVYWFVVYGVIGTTFIAFFFVIFPFLICYKLKKEFSIIVAFYLHLSVLLCSLTNPYIESVIGIIPMMMIVAYYFSSGGGCKNQKYIGV